MKGKHRIVYVGIVKKDTKVFFLIDAILQGISSLPLCGDFTDGVFCPFKESVDLRLHLLAPSAFSFCFGQIIQLVVEVEDLGYPVGRIDRDHMIRFILQMSSRFLHRDLVELF